MKFPALRADLNLIEDVLESLENYLRKRRTDMSYTMHLRLILPDMQKNYPVQALLPLFY